VPSNKKLVEVAVLMLVAAAATYGYRRPRFLLTVVAAMGLFDFPVHVAGQGTYLTEIALYAIVPFLAVRALDLRSVPWWVKIGSALLLLGSATAAVAGPVHGRAVAGTFRWLLALICLASALGVFAHDQRASRRLARLMLAIGSILTLGALEQRAGIYVLVGSPLVPGRIDSFLGYYTAYAGILAATFLVGMGDIAESMRAGEWPWLTAAGMLLVLIGLALSLSRGALVALGVGGVVFIATQLRRPSSAAPIMLAIATLLLIAWFVVPSSSIQSYQARFAAGSATAGDQIRTEQQAAGLHVLETDPLGIGYGNFETFASHSGLSRVLFHAHSTYIQIGLDNGWVGLIGFCVLMAGATATGLLSRSGLAAGFAAAIVSVLVQGLEDYLYYEVPYYVLTAMLIFGTLHAARHYRGPLAR
jgi:O-antigen ligase